jgi:two-component system NarL family response regulator
MIRVMLVDDHVMLREALRLMLEQDGTLQVVAEASDGETALKQVEDALPDVVVMDIAMPGLSGFETTKRLLARHADIKVLALSTYLDPRVIRQMLEQGAHGYVAKSAVALELKQGIHTVFGGRSFLSAEVAALMAAEMRTSRNSEKRSLSLRELQVAGLLAEGKTAPEIASRLDISAATVNVHRRNIMRKLDVRNAVELAGYAIRTGLIPP